MAILDKQWQQQTVGFISFIGLFLLFEGYEFGVGNQHVFLPVIDSLGKYPQLSSDFGAVTHLFYHPLFNWGMAALAKAMGLPTAFFCVQIFLLGGIYLSTRTLADLMGNSRTTYWFSLLLMFLWGQQGLDGNIFWANRLEAQFLAWPGIILALISYLRKHWFKAGFFAGLTAIFHLQMAAALGISLILTSICLREKQKRLFRLLYLSAGGLCWGLPVLFIFREVLFHQQLLIGPDFARYAAFRASPHMEWNMRLYFVFFLATCPPFSFLCFSPLKKCFAPAYKETIERLAIFQVVLLALGTLQYADYYLHLGILARLQPLRLMPLVYVTAIFFIARFFVHSLAKLQFIFPLTASLILFVLGPRLISYQSLRENLIYGPAALAFALISFCLVRFYPQKRWPLLPLFFLTAWLVQHAVWEGKTHQSYRTIPWKWDASLNTNDSWIKACRAASTLIPSDALVITPPYRSGFAFFAKRKTFIEYKSGANLRKDNEEWGKRISLTAGEKSFENCTGNDCKTVLMEKFNALDAEALQTIKNNYNAIYLLTESTQIYPYFKLYDDGQFRLYELTE